MCVCSLICRHMYTRLCIHTTIQTSSCICVDDLWLKEDLKILLSRLKKDSNKQYCWSRQLSCSQSSCDLRAQFLPYEKHMVLKKLDIYVQNLESLLEFHRLTGMGSTPSIHCWTALLLFLQIWWEEAIHGARISQEDSQGLPRHWLKGGCCLWSIR